MSEDIVKWGVTIIIEGIAAFLLLFYGIPWLSLLFFIIVGITIILWGIFGSKNRRDKKSVYDWLYKKATSAGHHKLSVGNYDDDRWQEIKDIADAVNLTPERVREICNIHKRIRRQKEGEYPMPHYEERWGLREFVGDGEPPKIDTIKQIITKEKIEPNLQDEILFDKVITVQKGDHKKLKYKFNQGDLITGIVSENAGDPFDFFIMDEKLYADYLNGEEVDYYDGEYNVVSFPINFTVPHNGTWYFVFDTYGKRIIREIEVTLRRLPKV